MTRKILAACCLLFLLVTCQDNDNGQLAPVFDPLLRELRSLPGVTVTEIEPYYGYPRAFQLDIVQPVDHGNPGGQTFTQRAYLHHASMTAPMAFAPSGYSISASYVLEVAGAFTTNHLAVVHRYFRDATPDPLDWQYLTVENAAADHHRIVTLLKQVYEDVPWVSGGRSKGGETALFHKRYYPEDVDATIAYVAPLLFSTSDQRVADFIDTAGGACADVIKDFQRRCLEDRAVMLPLFEEFCDSAGYMGRVPWPVAYEYIVVEYPHFFWSGTPGDCDAIPDAQATPTEMLYYLNSIAPFGSYTDYWLDYYEPYAYQAMTEIGYPAYLTEHLSDLLVAAPDPGGEIFGPPGVDCVYRPETLIDVVQWLQAEGNNIIYLYGGRDPWTGGAIELTGQTNAIKIVHPEGNHRVTIADLPDPWQVYRPVQQWMGIWEGVARAGSGFSVPAYMETDERIGR